MELWVEYLIRHGMPIARPPECEPFLDISPTFYIPRTPPVSDRVWAFFILNNIHIIAQYSITLERNCNVWTEGLLVPPPPLPLPTLKEQQTMVFRRVPYLERLWSTFQDDSHLFTSYPSISVMSSGTVPTVRRLLSAPTPIHP